MPRVYDKDPYAILGVPTTATAGQLKEAYHRLARQYHPDLNRDPRAAERMKDINWAHDILGDPYERSLYDAWRAATLRATAQPRPNPPPRSSPPPSYSPPPRTSTPPYRQSTRPPPPRTATVGKVTQSQAQGCSWVSVIWIAIMLGLNILRTPSRSTSSFPVYSVNVATQTAQVESMKIVLPTFQATQATTVAGTVTPWRTPTVASPVATVPRDAFGHEDIRASVVPGSWVWEQLDHYFPELTTENGLSDEVTMVVYDQLQGYHVSTRGSGDYWLFLYHYSESVVPVHFPPTQAVTPTENSPTPTP